ncbi:MAG: pseudouridine synthase [Clostridia bacterium]|nr:pseudouridine synthase [Clostridia bacterium]
MRLQKYMATCGVAARRKCEEIIAAGRVSVNGRIITEMGTQVEEGDEVLVDGRRIVPEEEKRYVLYHKPAGEVTTVADEKGRETVMDRFRDFPVRLYPVGRLDYDSEGLLLLTNDGELAQHLTHPSCEVDKVYLARVSGNPTGEEIERLRRGVFMEGDERRTYPAQVRVVRDEALFSDILVTIHEGRNRQVRRMFDAVGHRVLLLRRVRFGPLELGTLRRGEWRELTEQEIGRLRALCGVRG